MTSRNCALLIKSNKDFKCNICCCSIDTNKIIGLKCNIKKHIFCYECITDWYLEIKNNFYHVKYGNYPFIQMCPICRKNGGLLPNLNNHYISDIHYINNINILQTCGYKIKDDFCMNVGRNIYNNLCKIHFNMENKKKEHKEKDKFINSYCKSLNINLSWNKLKVNELRKIIINKEIHSNPKIFKKSDLVMILSNTDT
jgi:hypothetical protein